MLLPASNLAVNIGSLATLTNGGGGTDKHSWCMPVPVSAPDEWDFELPRAFRFSPDSDRPPATSSACGCPRTPRQRCVQAFSDALARQ